MPSTCLCLVFQQQLLAWALPAPCVSARPFPPTVLRVGCTALHIKHLSPWDLVPFITMLHTRPCYWMHVYVYRQKYQSHILGPPRACWGPSVRGCKKCHILFSGWSPNKGFLQVVVFLAHRSLQLCFPSYPQQKALAGPTPRAALSPTGRLLPFPLAASEPPSNIRPAALISINTVINRENPVAWHCSGSRRCSRSPGICALLRSSQAPPVWRARCPSGCDEVSHSPQKHSMVGTGRSVLDGGVPVAGKHDCIQSSCTLPPAGSMLNLAEGWGCSQG